MSSTPSSAIGCGSGRRRSGLSARPRDGASAEPYRECDEAAGRDSSEKLLPGIACADEDAQQLLPAADGEVPQSAHRQRCPAVAVCRALDGLELLERVYEGDADVDSNSLEVIVGRLRKKIGPELIETVRGLGYRLTAGDAG